MRRTLLLVLAALLSYLLGLVYVRFANSLSNRRAFAANFMMLTTTTGTSSIAARPIFSIISEKPGPDVDVMALDPALAAPTMAAIEASSSSIWTLAECFAKLY